MRIDKQTVYITDDGEVFLDPGTAKHHEEKLGLKLLLAEYICFGNEIADYSGMLDALLNWKHQ